MVFFNPPACLEVGSGLLAAEMMTAAGRVHYDARRLNDPRRYYAAAAQTATTAGNGIAAAYARLNASMLSSRGDSHCRSPSMDARPKGGVNLAAAAQAAARSDGGPKLRVLGAIYEAGAFSAR